MQISYTHVMATERFIHGKRDSCHHDGKYANEKRLQAAIYHQKNYLTEGDDFDLLDMETITPADEMRPTPVDSSFFVFEQRHGVPSTEIKPSVAEIQGQATRGKR